MKRDSSNFEPAGQPDADESQLPALSWMRTARAEMEVAAAVEKHVRRRCRRRRLVGAVAGTICLVAGFAWQHRPPAPNGSVASGAVVSLPERRILPDRSVVELREGAELEVAYSESVRRVRLRRGEAHFQVVKNSRPFDVEVAGVSVRAVGTGFSVRLEDKNIAVLVTEGQVRLQPASRSAEQQNEILRTVADAEAPLLTANRRAVIPVESGLLTGRPVTEPQIKVVSEAELADHLSWRVPHLEFSRSELKNVIALMNEHATGNPRVQFVIASDELQSVKLSGFLRADNADGLLRLLETNFGVTAERNGATIVLRRRR